MNKIVLSKFLILKLILLFVVTVLITYSLAWTVKYKVLQKTGSSPTANLSQAYRSDKDSQDTKPSQDSQDKAATAAANQKLQENQTEKTQQPTTNQPANTPNNAPDQTSQPPAGNQGGGSNPPPPPPVEIYAAQPIIFLGADTVLDLASYQSQVDASFVVVQDWYKQQLGGKTFNLIGAVSFRSPLTEAQLAARYPNGIGMWVDGLGAAMVANNLTLCNDHRFYYFVTPLNNVAGGMIGAENLGCNFVLPGTASIPNHMGRLIGGIFDPNWPEWWADEIREAQGGVAHEIGHGLGGSCTTGNYPGGGCNGLPHSQGPSIMFNWWDFGTSGVFFESEKTEILKSPFIK